MIKIDPINEAKPNDRVQQVMDHQATKVRKQPPAKGTSTVLSLRLDADVVAAYRDTGEGWQARINADLRKARGL